MNAYLKSNLGSANKQRGCGKLLPSGQPPYLAAPFLPMRRETVVPCRQHCCRRNEWISCTRRSGINTMPNFLLCPIKLFPITSRFISPSFRTCSITPLHGFIHLMLQLSHAGFSPMIRQNYWEEQLYWMDSV